MTALVEELRTGDPDAARQKIIADPAYLEKAEPHRVAALAGWRLYATTSLF